MESSRPEETLTRPEPTRPPPRADLDGADLGLLAGARFCVAPLNVLALSHQLCAVLPVQLEPPELFGRVGHGKL